MTTTNTQTNQTNNLLPEYEYDYKDITLPYASVPSSNCKLNANQIRHISDISRRASFIKSFDVPYSTPYPAVSLYLGLDSIMQQDSLDAPAYGSLINACCLSLNDIERSLCKGGLPPRQKRTLRKNHMSIVYYIITKVLMSTQWVKTPSEYNTLCVLSSLGMGECIDNFLDDNANRRPLRASFDDIKRLFLSADPKGKYTCLLIGEKVFDWNLPNV